MKNTFFAILAATAFSVAQTAESPATNNPEAQKQGHSGFYFSAGAGAHYTNISHLTLLSDTYKFYGTGFYTDLRLGWTVSNKVAIHGTIYGSYTNSTFYYRNDGFFGDNTSYRAVVPLYHQFIGAGATFFPFSNQAMNGAYLGVSLGYLDYESDDGLEEPTINVDGKGLGLVLEVGKTWNVSRQWRVGVGGTYSLGLFGKETSNSLMHSSEGSVLGLSSFAIQAKAIRK